MAAIVHRIRPGRPLPPKIQSMFLLEVESTLGVTFHADTQFEFSDDGDVKKATAIGDRHTHRFWYIARDRPYLRVRYGHYPTDGGSTRGRLWQPTPIEHLTDSQRHEIAVQRLVERRNLGHDKQREQHARQAEIAQQWLTAPSITAEFAYLKAKELTQDIPSDWRLVQHRFKRTYESQFNTTHTGRLLEEPAIMIPLQKVGDSTIVAAEYIAADGLKDSAYGLSPKQAANHIGHYDQERPIYLCEGAATAAIVHRITGCLTLRCGGATNLMPVAQELRKFHGASAQLIICAERGNGYELGVEAALAVAGAICTPPFSDAEDGSDFNDFYRLRCEEETRLALSVFQEPPVVSSRLGTQDSAVAGWLAGVNGKYFVAGRWGNEAAIGRDDDGRVARASLDSLKVDIASTRVPGLPGKSPHLFWIEHRDRRYYREVAYDPQWQRLDRNLDKNLWSGWGVEVNPDGKWDLFKLHIKDHIAAGDQGVYNYLLQWMAYLVQNPGAACGVAVVLRGAQGVGKGTLFNALLHLYGRHGCRINKAEYLIGSFTEHLENISFVFCDEVGWAGDHSFNDTLKSYITEPTIQIHPKGRRMYEVPNTLNFGFATNKTHAVSITSDNRRMCVIDVADPWAHLSGTEKSRERDAHFDPLYAQLANGGYGAMLHELKNTKLTGFSVRAFPRTRAASEQVAMSLGSVERWMVAILRDGVWRLGIGPNEWIEAALVDKKEMYSDYTEFAKNHRLYIDNDALFWKKVYDTFGGRLRQVGSRKPSVFENHVRRSRLIQLPALEVARTTASARLGVDVTENAVD